ncbi:MAG: glycosyltransferase [Phycisphaeraceae bacterium]
MNSDRSTMPADPVPRPAPTLPPTAIPFATSRPARAAEVRTMVRPVVRGKFLFVGDRKFYLRGVTYGPFQPTNEGCEYHDQKTVEADFAAMARRRINAVRLYTVPPRWLLDIAQGHGLRVMIGMPWEQHVAFLDDRRRPRQIIQRLGAMIQPIANHPAILAYAIGNEIPASIVRWHGPAKVERFLHRLYKTVKRGDPSALVTYVNFPTTEYLNLPFLDFAAFNVYLESPEKLTAYLSKLHSHAGDRPVIMAELGLDSLRHGQEAQAHTLHWQIRTAFESACAGLFVFSWTDEWHRGGADITDWAFGLTTRQRQPKPALQSVADAFTGIPFSNHRDWPRISVIVCSYNGARTIGDCCQGILSLKYPNIEVIVVDDGSRDSVGPIAHSYGFKVIRQLNAGLSSARNTGMEAATGEILVYLDDDARPDPDWLHYLAHTFMTTHHVAVGGPNLPPVGDGMIADCVANAPGGPLHVLITDQVAEHIPGCNFAVRREALMAVGGFDPQFRIAGDDVDLCWRLQEQGWTIGFSPGAMVWHHRRNSIDAYLRQQRNYGRAEAMLENKWPWKYNAAGHIPWSGRIYGRGKLETFQRRRGHIYQGIWGTAPFQSMYQSPPGLVSSLPLMPEWYLIIFALASLSVMSVFWPHLWPAPPLLAIALAAPIMQALMGAAHASFVNSSTNRMALADKYLITAWLHLLQPIVRFHGRLRGGLHPLRPRGATRFRLPRRRRITVWHEEWSPPEKHLETVETNLERHNAAVRRGGEWDSWDLRVSGGLLGGARLRMALEEHGQGKQQLCFALWPTWSAIALGLIVMLGVLGAAALADGAWIVGSILAGSSLGLGLKALTETGSAIAAMIEAIDPSRRKGTRKQEGTK